MAGKKDLERLRRRRARKQIIIRVTMGAFVWMGIAVLYYFALSLFFDTPVEYKLRHSTDRLRHEYEALSERYDSLNVVLGNVVERDRSVFRNLFESDPYDFDSEYERKKAETYETVLNKSTRRLRREFRGRVTAMEEQLTKLNNSYLALQASIDAAGNQRNNI
ncbi:MAG: M23 family peptidase, partial [Alistipes sp.]